MRTTWFLLSSETSWWPSLDVLLVLLSVLLLGVNGLDLVGHRLTHVDLAARQVGCKSAAVALEVRTPNHEAGMLRKAIVADITEMGSTLLTRLLELGAGAIVLLVPENTADLAQEEREGIANLENYLLNQADLIEIPVYFVQKNEEISMWMQELLQSNQAAHASAFQAFVDGVMSYGYHLSSTATALPRPMPQQSVASFLGQLKGKSGRSQRPSVLIVAHYDHLGLAPGLVTEGNGSGVTILLELARVFEKIFEHTRPDLDLFFLLSGGGGVNYFGTKKFLEDDHNALADVRMVVCLDEIAQTKKLFAHVSKMPKEETMLHKFFTDLREIGAKHGVSVETVHKKINLAEDSLAWEHERFSIAKIGGGTTLSHHSSAVEPDRNSMLASVDVHTVARNTRVIAEALACSLYDVQVCEGDLFGGNGSASVRSESLRALHSLYRSQSMATPFTLGQTPKGKARASDPLASLSPSVRSLSHVLSSFTHDSETLWADRESRDAEFVFYDSSSTMFTAHKVKPAFFDLVLTLCIAAYLGLLYLGLNALENLAPKMISFKEANGVANGKNGKAH